LILSRFAVVKEDEETNQNNRIISIMSKPSVRTKGANETIVLTDKSNNTEW
jgi:hypothetical protein